jgi:hypothetical protein
MEEGQRGTIVPAVNFGEIGYTGLERYGGTIFEEFLPELRWPNAGQIYKKMAHNDAVIGSIMFIAQQLVRGASWKVIPGGKGRQDKLAAEFVEECLDDMSRPFKDYITEILSSFIYGFAWHEIVYKKREGYNRKPGKSSKFNDGKIGWRKFPGRAQTTIEEWIFEESRDGLLGVEQSAPPHFKRVFIPIDKSLHFRTTIEKDNPEGRSLLRTAYRAWFFKTRIEEIEGIGIERDLAGLPVLTPPEGLDIWQDDDPSAVKLRQMGEKLVRNIRRDQNEGVMKPFGWTLELLSAGGRRQYDTGAIINRYDQRIAITMLADLVMLGADKVGSFALAEVKKDLLGMALETQLQGIADVFNRHAIPRLMVINGFNLERFPEIVPGQVTTPNLTEISRMITALSGAGADLFPNDELEDILERALGVRLKLKKKEELDSLGMPPPGKGTSPPAPEGEKGDGRVQNQRVSNTDKV